MASIWATKESHPEVFEATFDEACLVVRRSFAFDIPVCAATLSCESQCTVGIEVQYLDFGWDETLADSGKDRAYAMGRGVTGLRVAFDTYCTEFCLTVLLNQSPTEVMVELHTADLNSSLWVIHPANKFDFVTYT